MISMERVSALALLVILGSAGCTGNISGGDGDGDGDGDGGGGGMIDANTNTSDLVYCVDETNRYRQMNGKAPLAHSQALEDYANQGAMIDTQQSSAHYHFSSTSGGGIAFAENECPSFLGWTVMGTVRNTITQCIAAFYSEGPGGGHYENMMGNYGSLGCGVYVQGQGITITQDYGR